MFKSIFDNNMFYMAPPGETPQGNVEKKDASSAKAKIESQMINNSPEQEAKRDDENARADVVAIFKQGKKFDATVPGLDAATVKQVKDSLKNKLPTGDDRPMATTRMEVTITVEEKGQDVEKTLYFVAIADGTKTTPNDVSFLYKADQNFDPNSRTMVRDVPDAEMLDLMGVNSKAAKSRMETRKNEEEAAKKEFDEAKAKFDASKKTDADKKEYTSAEAEYNKIKKALDDFQKNYQLAMSGKKVADKTA